MCIGREGFYSLECTEIRPIYLDIFHNLNSVVEPVHRELSNSGTNSRNSEVLQIERKLEV